MEAQLTAARHDKTCDDLAAVLWTVQIAASEIEPVADGADIKIAGAGNMEVTEE